MWTPLFGGPVNADHPQKGVLLVARRFTREQMRAAAKAAGVKLGSLFAESLFVSRARAEEWCDTARAEGRDEMVALYTRLAAPAPEFKALGDAVRATIARGGFKNFLRGDDVASADETQEAEAAARAKATADAIIRAGERARSDGSNERPAPTGLAKRIVDSGIARHVPFGDEKK
jgi:hypothetical protein